MRHSTLDLPTYDTVAQFEGKGNWAVSKYYRFPYRFFYRHKIKMIMDMFGEDVYTHLLDYGCGPQILKKTLKNHSLYYKGYDIGDVFDPRWRFDVVVLASVLEFVNVEFILHQVKSVLRKGGFIVVSSPMDTWISRQYFKLIGDQHIRNSHERIISGISKIFKIEKVNKWMGLYFSVKACND